jgi:putative ABC transport system permease protein
VSNRDLLRLVLSNLNRMRARVILTAIGVIVGTAAVVLLVSLSVGVQANLSGQMEQFGDLTVIQVNPGGSGSMFAMGGTSQRDEVKRDEVKLDEKAIANLRTLPHVVVVTPRVSPQGSLSLKLGRDETYAYIQGIDPEAADQLGWDLASGLPRLARGQIVVGPKVFEGMDFVMMSATGAVIRGGPGTGASTPEPRDMQGRTLTAVLTRFDQDNQEVTKSERLRVVGVFKESGGMYDRAIYAARADVEAWDQWFTGKRRSARQGYDEVLVKVDAAEHVRDVQNAIDDMGFNTYSSQQIVDQLGQYFLIIRAVLGGVGGIALLVAAFGIANTMTMAIYERTKEIGVMKAIGATNRDVLRIFLAEASAIGALGGLLGVLLGWGGGKAINLALQMVILQSQAGAPPPDEPADPVLITPLWLMLFALGFATLVGLVSGIYPALRAASMKPLRALHSE